MIYNGVEVKPCPCCGEFCEFREEGEELKGLYIGANSADSQCVQCYTCGLRMVRHFPNEIPFDNVDGSAIEFMKQLREYTNMLCLMAWNRREGSPE